MDKAADTMEFSAVGQVREVEVYKYNVDVDWACLKLKDVIINLPGTVLTTYPFQLNIFNEIPTFNQILSRFHSKYLDGKSFI